MLPNPDNSCAYDSDLSDQLLDRAAEGYNQMIRLDPKYANAYRSRGETYVGEPRHPGLGSGD